MSFLTDPDYSKKYWAARDAAKDLPVEIYKRLQDKGEYLELRLCERSEGI